MNAEPVENRQGSGAVEPRPLRIVVVSEVCFLREALAGILECDPSLSVVGRCADLVEAMALGPALQPHVVLVDAALRDGVAAVRRTRQIVPSLRLVAYGVKESKEEVIAWAEAGVIGYVPNTAALTDLTRLVRDIWDGEQPCSRPVAAELIRRVAVTASLGAARTASFPLTRRERQIAELITTGLSDREIARWMNIGLATAKSHVHSLLRKLNVRRRAQVSVRLREYEPSPPA